MVQTTPTLARFPNLPSDPNFINKETGKVNTVWMGYFQQLTLALQTNYKNEGLVIPAQPTTNLTGILTNQPSYKNIIYDSSLDLFKGNINGTWVTFLTSASTVVSNVFGTSNIITAIPSTGNVVIDISPSYAGQTSITTLGTVTTGTWNASIIPLAYGGTNANLTASNGGIIWSNATQLQILSGTATANQVLLSGSSATPTWSTAIYPATTTINQLLYSSSANVIGGLTTANNGVLITSAGGIPSISSTLPSTVQGNITSLGTISSGVWNGTVITGQYGGTGIANTGLTINLGSGGTGKVLASDVSGNATWTALSGIAVTSITGTANQINTSASTGAVTLSLSSTIVTPGTLSVNGTSNPNATTTLNATTAYNTNIIGVQTAQNNSNQLGLYVSSTFAPAAQLFGSIYSIYNTPTITVPNIASPIGGIFGQYIYITVGGAAQTVAVLYGLYIANPTIATAIVTTAYGLYVVAPTQGGTNFAANIGGLIIDGAGTGNITTGIWSGTNVALNHGGTNGALTANNGGIVWCDASQMQILAGTATASKILLSGATATPSWSTSTIPTSAGATANKVLLSDGTNYVLSTPTFPNASATSGKTIRSDGTNWIASTATLSDVPSTALKWLRSDGTNWITSTSTLSDTPSTAGKVLISDGTNWITSTPTFPNASASSGKFIRSDGTNWIASTPTLPTSAGTSGKVLQSDGTNYVESIPTYPSASGSSGKILISDGTNNVYSTPTYPNSASGTGTILRADGTNWVATTTTYPNTNAINTIMYASSANILDVISAVNNGVMISGTTGIPSWLSAGSTGQVLVATTSNPASWSTLSGIAVTSISGTTNQINASASIGAVTLSLSSTIVTPGTLAVNGSLTANSATTLNATGPYNTYITGIQTTQTGNNEFCLYINPILSPSSSISGKVASIYHTPEIDIPTGSPGIVSAYGEYLKVTIGGTGSRSLTNYYGFYIDLNSTPGSSVITNAYSLYVNSPSVGGGNSFITTAIYSDNIVVGSASTGPPRDQFGSPTGGVLISKNLVMNTAALATSAVDGFIYESGCAGKPTGTPTAQTGRVPMIYDTTNSISYHYNGSWIGGSMNYAVVDAWSVNYCGGL